MGKPSSFDLLVTMVALSTGLVAAEVWILRRTHREAAGAMASLQQKKQERTALARSSLTLSPENEAAVTADLLAGRRALAAWSSELQVVDARPPASLPPARSADAFFALNDFAEQFRIKAAQAQVAIRAGERFGFALYAHEGPPPGLLEPVHRQCQEISNLLDLLLESRPRALLAVKRQNPGPAGAPDQRTPAEDFFAPGLAPRLAGPHQTQADTFRLDFTGHTAVLRDFLNRLANFRPVSVVRRVEVEPVESENPPRTSPPFAEAAVPRPFVKPGLMKFGVTIELVRLIDQAGAGLP